VRQYLRYLQMVLEMRVPQFGLRRADLCRLGLQRLWRDRMAGKLLI
jgi:hypothetical protein